MTTPNLDLDIIMPYSLEYKGLATTTTALELADSKQRNAGNQYDHELKAGTYLVQLNASGDQSAFVTLLINRNSSGFKNLMRLNTKTPADQFYGSVWVTVPVGDAVLLRITQSAMFDDTRASLAVTPHQKFGS